MPADAREQLMHATALASAGRCVLLVGPPGSGKSDLALRLIAWPPLGLDLPPFTLLSDDQVLLSRDGDRLIARPPPTIAGRLEVRGVGIVEMPHAASAVVTVVIRMCKADAVERMPEPALQTLAGCAIPAFELFPFEPSAPLKVALAVKKALDG